MNFNINQSILKIMKNKFIKFMKSIYNQTSFKDVVLVIVFMLATSKIIGMYNSYKTANNHYTSIKNSNDSTRIKMDSYSIYLDSIVKVKDSILNARVSKMSVKEIYVHDKLTIKEKSDLIARKLTLDSLVKSKID